jgi:Kae1-associated kinase Bud32
LFRKGAEAEIDVINFMGTEAVRKTRVVKNYRLPELDGELRKSRTKKEVRLINEVKGLGILTPFIEYLDLIKGVIVMEYVKGCRLKDFIDEIASGEGAGQEKLLGAVITRIGMDVGKMHANGITHGDLTTSNMLFYEKDADEMKNIAAKGKTIDPDDIPVYFIDLSLGERRAGLENMGEDLDVFFKAFDSTHPALMEYVEHFWAGYASRNPGVKEVKERLADIKKRARYR